MNDREKGSSYYKDMPDNGYWNILFLNTHTNEQHLLTEDKMIILDYNYKSKNETGITMDNNHIFYTIRSTDYNNDSLINEKDPVYLFVSDKMGKNFRQLSPDGYSIYNWEYMNSSKKIILSVHKDSNKNNYFDNKDEVNTFEILLDQDETPKEVFDTAIKDKMKQLYNNYWKKIK